MTFSTVQLCSTVAGVDSWWTVCGSPWIWGGVRRGFFCPADVYESWPAEAR